MLPRGLRPLRALALLLLASTVAASAALPALAAGRQDAAALLADAQTKLDAGDASAALALAQRALDADAQLAGGYLVRGSARLMLGEAERGRQDLDRAIALDPQLRQAFLNRAAFAMAEGRNAEALADFQRARELAPEDADGHLNVGAAELVLGRLDDAAKSFERYLSAHPQDATAQYLVARNYALAGYAGLAVQSLQRAVALDERMRAAARMDVTFQELAANPRFQEVLNVDRFQPPAGAAQASRSFPNAAYAAGQGPLLAATLDALQTLRERYEPRIDVGNQWAVVWGDMRVKILDRPDGSGGIVELSAPPGKFAAADWKRKSDLLLNTIELQLARRRGSGARQPG
jgi:tetratricopeptide (TPR) repeat protein